MPDFVLGLVIDATASKEGSRQARSAVDDVKTGYQQAIKILDKYDNQLAKLKGYDSELRRVNKTLSQPGVKEAIDDSTKALLRQKAALVDEERAAQRLAKEMAKVQREAERAGQARISRVANAGQGLQSGGQAMQNFGTGLTTTLTAPILALTTLGLKFNATKEQALVSFGVLLKSGEKAKQLFGDLQKFAADTPFEMPEINQATKSLLAFGVAQENILPTLTRIGDIASGINVPMSELAEIYGKAKTQGRLFSEDINQMTGRGIPIIQELAKQFGVSEAEVKNLVEAGKVGFPQLEKAFADMTSEGGQFAGMMQAQSKTFSGQMSTLLDSANTTLGQLSEPLFALIKTNLPAVITFISRIGGAFADLSPEIQTFIVFIAGIAAALGPVLLIIGTLTIGVGAFISTIAAAAGAVGGFTALGAVIALVGSAVALLAAGVGAAIAVVYGLVEAWKSGFGPVASIVAVGVGLILTAIAPILGLPILIGAMLATLYGIWTTNFAGLRDTAVQIWNKIAAVVGAAMTELTEFVNEQGAEVIAWWRENYPLIEQTISNVSERIKGTVQGFLTTVSAFWESHGEQIKAVVSAIWTIIRTVVATGIQVVLGVIRIGLQVINGDWSGAWETFKAVVAKIPGALLTILNGLNTIVWNALKFIVTAIVNVGATIFNSALQLGKNLIEGIVEGISSRVAAVRTKIGEVVEMVRSLPAAGWLIKSPSRLFASYGQFLMEGLAVGIENSSLKVANTLKRSVVERVKNVRKELAEVLLGNASLGKTDSREFQLQFDLLQANQAKTKLEELIKLRVELGENFDKPLPQTFGGILSELSVLESRKSGIEEVPKLFADFDDILSKLPQDATNLEKVNALLADPRRSAGIEATTKALLLMSAAAADMAENTAKINKEFDSLSRQNTDRITDLKKQLLLFGVEDPAKRREIEMSFEDISRFSPEQQQQILDQRGVELGQIGELDSMKKRAEAVKFYKETLASLNETLRGNIELTERQKTENEILKGSYDHLTSAEKQELLVLADKIDAQKQLKEAYEKTRSLVSEFVNAFAAGKNLKESFGNVFKLIRDKFKQMLAQMLTDWLTSRLSGILTGQNRSSGGGNPLSAVFGKMFGGGGGGAGGFGGNQGGATPPFIAPNFSNGGGVNSVISQISGNLQNQLTRQSLSNLSTTGTLDSSLLLRSGSTFSTDQIYTNTASAALSSGKFSLSGLGGTFGGLAPMLGMSLGAGLGGNSGLGQILGGAGGLLGGVAAMSVLAPTAFAGLVGSIGGGLGLSAGSIAGLAGALPIVGAIAAPLLLLGGWLLGRNKKRRQEEIQRTQIINDSFAQLDDLIKQVNTDRMDGQTALANANGIRSQYLQQVNQLTDKKTRNIAVKDVSRLDSKIDLLRLAAESQDKRRSTAKELTADFASGVYISSGMFNQLKEFRRRNGVLPGNFNGMDSLPSMLAKGEMVLNPTQIENVKSNAGFDAFRGAGIPGYANGAYLRPTSISQPLNNSRVSNIEPDVIIIEKVEIDAEGIAFSGLKSQKGKKYILQTVREVLIK